MANNPVSGIAYFIAGFGLIHKKGVRGLVYVPLFINTLMFIALIIYGWGQLDTLSAYLQSLLPSWLEWLSWLLWPLFVITALACIMFGFSITANLIGAPFNAQIAEAVERRLRPDMPEESGGINWGEIFKTLIPAIWDEVRKLLYYLLWLLPILLLLIPPLNLIFPFVWFAFSAWMLAVGYADYPMGNHKMKFAQQRALLKRKRMLVLGFGVVALGAGMVPLLNLLAIPAAVAGAAKMWVNEFLPLQQAETGDAHTEV